MKIIRKKNKAYRDIFRIVYDVIKLFARQGLPFRAHGINESLYSLKNPNLLDIIKTFAEYKRFNAAFRWNNQEKLGMKRKTKKKEMWSFQKNLVR